MTTKITFGDPKAIRLLQLEATLKGVREVMMIELENDQDPYILQCPTCKSEDLEFGRFDINANDDMNSISTCKNCGQKIGDGWLFDELKEIKKLFK